MAYAKSAVEKETIITFNEKDLIANVYTHHLKYIYTLRDLAKERPEDVKILTDYVPFDNHFMEVEVPKSWIHISPKRQSRKTMTDEQKAAASERLRKAREKRWGQN